MLRATLHWPDRCLWSWQRSREQDIPSAHLRGPLHSGVPAAAVLASAPQMLPVSTELKQRKQPPTTRSTGTAAAGGRQCAPAAAGACTAQHGAAGAESGACIRQRG